MSTSNINCRWTLRRRTMLIALYAGLAYPLLLLIAPEDAAKHLVGVSAPFYVFVTFIITTYTAGVTWEENRGRVQGSPEKTNENQEVK